MTKVANQPSSYPKKLGCLNFHRRTCILKHSSHFLFDTLNLCFIALHSSKESVESMKWPFFVPQSAIYPLHKTLCASVSLGGKAVQLHDPHIWKNIFTNFIHTWAVWQLLSEQRGCRSLMLFVVMGMKRGRRGGGKTNDDRPQGSKARQTNSKIIAS